ncbi:gpW family head-tail joining protein [Ruegeria arenilitoris]|uniref:gpW family head-tail joining protein n=1 Tax=Ruegeria arenilitoris TaxID=1173585 RepID=UPI00147F135C|nr:gpW family head-tail joining protein [Ruegeria arenilitoris]
MPTETETRIAEAEAALHKLLLGTKVVKVEYDGATTEFQRANITELRRYIRSLKRSLPDAASGAASRKVTF